MHKLSTFVLKNRGFGVIMRDSDDRAILKAYKTILETSDEVTAQRRKDLRISLEALAKSSIDDRVRLGALKQIFELDRQIADYEYKLFEHDNPAVQKSEIEHKGLPEIPKEITFRIAE
jgi:hypothetical protein